MILMKVRLSMGNLAVKHAHTILGSRKVALLGRISFLLNEAQLHFLIKYKADCGWMQGLF